MASCCVAGISWFQLKQPSYRSFSPNIITLPLEVMLGSKGRSLDSHEHFIGRVSGVQFVNLSSAAPFIKLQNLSTLLRRDFSTLTDPRQDLGLALIGFHNSLTPFTGKTTILVVVDRLSKSAQFSALGSQFSAPQVVSVFIRDIVCLHGFPSTIFSDHDPLFMSTFWKELFRLQGTTLATNIAYHP